MQKHRIAAGLACAALLGSIAVTAAAGIAKPVKKVLYVGGILNGLNVVRSFDASDPRRAPLKTLKGMSAPVEGMAVDADGNLYVSQLDANEPVLVYKPGKTTPFRVLTQSPSGPIGAAFDVAVDSKGNVYAMTEGTGATGIAAYKAGATKPYAFLTYNDSNGTPICSFGGIAVDKKNNLYLACEGGPNGTEGRVIEFRAGKRKGVDLGITVAGEWTWPSTRASDLGFFGVGQSIQVDSAGNLLVLTGVYLGAAIFVYPPGSRRPSHVIPLVSLANPTANSYESYRTTIRLDASETHVFVNEFHLPTEPNQIDEYSYPDGKHKATFKKGLPGSTQGASGIATSEAAP